MTRLQDMPVVTVEQITRFRDEALKIERELDAVATTWERTMNEAIGEDGPASVAKAIQELKSRVDFLNEQNSGLQGRIDKVREIVDARMPFSIKFEEILAVLGPQPEPDPEPEPEPDKICPDWNGSTCPRGCAKNCGVPF